MQNSPGKWNLSLSPYDSKIGQIVAQNDKNLGESQHGAIIIYLAAIHNPLPPIRAAIQMIPFSNWS